MVLRLLRTGETGVRLREFLPALLRVLRFPFVVRLVLSVMVVAVELSFLGFLVVR